MKILRTVTLYPTYIDWFYRRNTGLDSRSYAEQKAALDYDAFAQTGAWVEALAPHGYEVVEAVCNPRLQRAWLRDQGDDESLARHSWDVVRRQLEHYRPEILWTDNRPPVEWLQRVREECPWLRLLMGWYCAPIGDLSYFRAFDLVIACSPQLVEQVRDAGGRVAMSYHAFNRRVLERIPEDTAPGSHLVFVGSVARRPGFHMERSRLLETLSETVDIQIYSPQAEVPWLRDTVDTGVRLGVYAAVRALRGAGVSQDAIARVPVIGKGAGWQTRSYRQRNPKLAPFMRPAVYGLEMFRTLRDAGVLLNTHGDIASTAAANIRLFEATGVGTCLLTDWKPNLSDLFEPDREVAVYRSHEECLEKVRWLLEHPKERDEIARAGQRRALRDHTWANRAVDLDRAIQGALAERAS